MLSMGNRVGFGMVCVAFGSAFGLAGCSDAPGAGAKSTEQVEAVDAFGLDVFADSDPYTCTKEGVGERSYRRVVFGGSNTDAEPDAFANVSLFVFENRDEPRFTLSLENRVTLSDGECSPTKRAASAATSVVNSLVTFLEMDDLALPGKAGLVDAIGAMLTGLPQSGDLEPQVAPHLDSIAEAFRHIDAKPLVKKFSVSQFARGKYDHQIDIKLSGTFVQSDGGPVRLRLDPTITPLLKGFADLEFLHHDDGEYLVASSIKPTCTDRYAGDPISVRLTFLDSAGVPTIELANASTVVLGSDAKVFCYYKKHGEGYYLHPVKLTGEVTDVEAGTGDNKE